MSEKFDETFSEPLQFDPEGWYLSANLFNREQAAEIFRCPIEEVGEEWVRFEPSPWCCRDEIGDMAWMVKAGYVSGAQPCWYSLFYEGATQ